MEILERHYEEEAQRGEYEAEVGSSYFYSGMSSWDASACARAHMNAMREEFEASPEGQEFRAKLEAAKFMADTTCGLGVVTQEEINDYRVFTPTDALRVPEFWPGVIVKSDFNPDPSKACAFDDIF